jgi:hypothetical protein
MRETTGVAIAGKTLATPQLRIPKATDGWGLGSAQIGDEIVRDER